MVKYELMVLAMPLLVVWFLLTTALVLSQPVPTVSDMAPAPMPTPPPGCPRVCGDVEIPYPFGIGVDCAWPGLDYFTVTCNLSTPYIGNVEIINISLEAGEMRVFAPVSYNCYNSLNTIESGINWELSFADWPYLISQGKNVFTAIGCHTLALLEGMNDWSYLTGCITTCASSEDAAQDGEQCTGLGCCQTPSIPGNLSTEAVYWGSDDLIENITYNNLAWEDSPCSYAFMGEKGWYSFKRKDLVGNMSFVNRVEQEKGVPLVLDWAIRKNGTCPLESGETASPVVPYGACVSAHSYCVNARNGPGYLCNCSKGYHGNPYVQGVDGCTNIDECQQRKSDPLKYEKIYPCYGGICHDTEGGYECKCGFGRTGNGTDDKGCQPMLPTSAVAVIATICAISILALLLIYLHMEREKRKLKDYFNKNGGQLLKNLGIRIFTKKEMDQMTKNYSELRGKGAFGEVYKGTTENNQQIAVKRPIRESPIRANSEELEDFTNEVKIQSQISHKNVVRLLGCCLQTNTPMLVYEFIPKGSLYDVLHNNNTFNNNAMKHNLSLQVRLDIAIDSADALNYMHSSLNQKILHGDVKSGNILLDDKFMPKVSDFGISRLLSVEKHHTKFVIGDMNYIDPVYMKTGLLTEKSDVYGYGVVLLELITGKKARYDGNNSLPINFVKSYMRESRAREMFDEEITSKEGIDCLEMIGGIAVQCLKEDVDERPTMQQVLEQLNLVRKECMHRQGHMSCDHAFEIAIDLSPRTPQLSPM